MFLIIFRKDFTDHGWATTIEHVSLGERWLRVKFHGCRVQLHISPPARSWLPSTSFTSNGQDLRKRPLVARKAALKPLINETEIQFSKSFEIDGRR